MAVLMKEIIHLKKVGPGQLSTYPKNNEIDNYVYNGGEAFFLLFSIPTKILNFYKEYKPDMFVIELPDTDKVDVEISAHHWYIYKQAKRLPVPICPKTTCINSKIGNVANNMVGLK